MKKLYLLFISFFMSFLLFSQEVVLTFNPADGVSSIDSIKATNTLTGKSGTVVGINSMNLNNIFTSTENLINGFEDNVVYPNPFQNKAIIKYTAAQKEELNVIISNSVGQVVASFRSNVDVGTQRFEMSVKSKGIYFVTIIGEKSKVSIKAICLQNQSYENHIGYLGYSNDILKIKSVNLNPEVVCHFKIYSGKNITIIADKPTISKTYKVNFYKCEDKDGKNYPIVQIGNQWWMAENLNYLPSVSPSSISSENNPLYYVNGYEGTSVNEAKTTISYKKYGVLYNYNAAKLVCPVGWHIANDSDWETLGNLIKNQNVGYVRDGEYWFDVGKHLKAYSGWPNRNGIDNYGFSGLPGGCYYWEGNDSWKFDMDGINGFWWSDPPPLSPSCTPFQACDLQDRNDVFIITAYSWTYGFSVRCVKD